MKKMMALILCLISITTFGQEKIGSYSSSYFDGRSFNISASEPKNGKFNVYIEVGGKHKTDDVQICVSNKNIEEFKSALVSVRDKFFEWKETAEANNVKDITKDFPYIFPKVDIAWYGSKWYFHFGKKISPTFFVFKDGSCAMVVYTKAQASSNEYITQEVYWVLKEREEFDDIIKYLDEAFISDYFAKKNNAQDLFQ